jgi:hypothetical protein
MVDLEGTAALDKVASDANAAYNVESVLRHCCADANRYVVVCAIHPQDAAQHNRVALGDVGIGADRRFTFTKL